MVCCLALSGRRFGLPPPTVVTEGLPPVTGSAKPSGDRVRAPTEYSSLMFGARMSREYDARNRTSAVVCSEVPSFQVVTDPEVL